MDTMDSQDECGAESLIEISSWIVGWSRVVPSRFNNPGVCIHIQTDVTASSKQRHSTFLRTRGPYFHSLHVELNLCASFLVV